MAQVTVTLNGTTYCLKCADGEEVRLHGLVDHIRDKLEHLVQEFGPIGSEHLLLMAAILISDELFEARDKIFGQNRFKSF